ncbi:MAG: ABC transporter permease [Firmicutes bacterium]|nr:ABC transporter permease [Bacillota bacterium]
MLIVILVSVLTFFLVDLIPGDVVLNVAGKDDIDEAEYWKIYYELNLDKSTPERFVLWLKGVLKLDFGTSYIYHKPVWDLIKTNIPPTLYLSLLATLISVPIGVFFGIISAVNRKKKSDTIITLTANICNCLPQFWIGLLLTFLLAVKLKWLPTMGFGWPSKVGLAKHIKYIIMPLICLSLGGIAGFTRQTRSSMLEVIRQDYIRTARSKGLSKRRVNFKHMMKNGLIPILTILGGRISRMIGGSMIIENLFAIPGMGVLTRNSIMAKDLPTIQAIVMITTAFSCIAFLLTDIAYMIVDPRISLAESEE